MLGWQTKRWRGPRVHRAAAVSSRGPTGPALRCEAGSPSLWRPSGKCFWVFLCMTEPLRIALTPNVSRPLRVNISRSVKAAWRLQPAHRAGLAANARGPPAGPSLWSEPGFPVATPDRLICRHSAPVPVPLQSPMAESHVSEPTPACVTSGVTRIAPPSQEVTASTTATTSRSKCSETVVFVPPAEKKFPEGGRPFGDNFYPKTCPS